MICPRELELDLPKEVGAGMISRTGQVWKILSASAVGDLSTIKALVAACPGLAYAQYNYAPPIHFAVREGHAALVRYLLELGAHDPAYRIYPFLDSLETIAADRGLEEIENRLMEYAADPSRQRFSGDNGKIFYERSEEALQLEKAIAEGDLQSVEVLLDRVPELAHDQTLNWSEGILAVPAKLNDQAMVRLLLNRGAKVPARVKWAPVFYFKHYQMAAFLLSEGMDPDTQSWQRVTLLHNMAQQGDIPKATLLLDAGADINAIDEAYQSTPLGMAARWGQQEMVQLLLERGALKQKAGAPWAVPLTWARHKGYREIATMLME